MLDFRTLGIFIPKLLLKKRRLTLGSSDEFFHMASELCTFFFENPLKTVVMDVSGSIAANPRKDEYTFEFFENLLVQFEADTQVKLSIVSFSDSATLNLPLDFYSVEDVRDAVSDLIWVGQGRDFYEN